MYIYLVYYIHCKYIYVCIIYSICVIYTYYIQRLEEKGFGYVKVKVMLISCYSMICQNSHIDTANLILLHFVMLPSGKLT